jgi:ornithine cyclodeaminase/alanine dehydrogenase-like protein (mu-crystallin family)
MVVSLMGLQPTTRTAGGRLHLVGKPTHTGGPRHSAYKIIFDLDTMNLVGLLEDGPVHAAMLAARVAVATSRLARPDAREVAVLGSGRMAAASLRGVLHARPATRVSVFSPNVAHRNDFAERLSGELDIEILPVDTPRAAVEHADIVTCATNTHFRDGTPVLAAGWLQPGCHVNTIARSELDGATYELARVFPPTWADLLAIEPGWERLWPLVCEGRIRTDGDLASVVRGSHQGRTSAQDVTVYVGPSTGPEHAAVGRWVIDMAKRNGIGTEWDQDITSV